MSTILGVVHTGSPELGGAVAGLINGGGVRGALIGAVNGRLSAGGDTYGSAAGMIAGVVVSRVSGRTMQGGNFGAGSVSGSDVSGAVSTSGERSYRDGYFTRGFKYVLGAQVFGSAPITDQEREFAKNGNRKAFWTSRRLKDPLAGFALDIIDKIGVGDAANKRLIAYGLWKGLTVNLEEVGIALMRAHVRAVDADKDGVMYLLSPDQVALYHHEVFASFGLPKNTFGGTSSGNLWETSLTRVGWCLGCDWNE